MSISLEVYGMDKPAYVRAKPRRHRFLDFSMPVLIATSVANIFFAWIFYESGYHYYWAEGMTEGQARRTFGEPEWRERGIHDGTDYLRYYTGFLNIVDLKVRYGKVVQVEIRPDD